MAFSCICVLNIFWIFMTVIFFVPSGSCTCTYEETRHYALYGFNDEILQNTSIEECKTKCSDGMSNGKICLSFDYIKGSCFLSTQTKATQPSYFGKHRGAVYYEKVCVLTPAPTAPPLRPDDCKINQRGSNYQGKISQTVSGRTCQEWGSQYPHSHGYNENRKFPERSVRAAKNYCRNPKDSIAAGPWCYTTDPDVRWELCNIPECVGTCNRPCYTNPCVNPDVCLAHHPVYCTSKFCGGCQPVYYHSSGNSVLNCSDDKPPPPFTFSCKMEVKGKEYRGTHNTTYSGKTCQRWDMQTPHEHGMTEPQFLDLSIHSAENFCRNPDGESLGPWCYTTDPGKRWEYCAINTCLGRSSNVCQNNDMWLLAPISVTGGVRCYKFFLYEQYHMTWSEARSFCEDQFGEGAYHASAVNQEQLSLLRVNAESYIRELQIRKVDTIPDKVLIWYSGLHLNTDLLPVEPRTPDNSRSLRALKLWPGKPALEFVSSNQKLGFVCNEIPTVRL